MKSKNMREFLNGISAIDMMKSTSIGVSYSAHIRSVKLTEQSRAPLWEAVKARGRLSVGLHHTPPLGKGRAFLKDPYSREIYGQCSGYLLLETSKSDEEVDDPHHPNGPLAEAMQLYADAVGAKQTLFLVSGASQGNWVMLSAVLRPGDEIILPRGTHKSAEEHIILNPWKPRYVETPFSPIYESWGPLSPLAVEEACRRYPNARVIFLQTPTYPGHCADIAPISEIARQEGKLLLVDAAWGAHFPFCHRLPQAAIESGAAIAVESAHKCLAVIEPGAVLHLGHNWDLDEGAIWRWYRHFTTTSPSFPLLAIIDAARRQAVLFGQTIFTELIELAHWFRHSVASIKGIKVVEFDDYGFEYYEADPLKVTLDVTATGLTGIQFARLLKEYYGEQVEMATNRTILILITISEDQSSLERLLVAIRSVVNRFSTGEKLRLPAIELPGIPKLEVMPYEVIYNGKSSLVPLREAKGCCAAQSAYCYPPGWRFIVEGELISPEIIEYAETCLAHERQVYGLQFVNGKPYIKVLESLSEDSFCKELEGEVHASQRD